VNSLVNENVDNIKYNNIVNSYKGLSFNIPKYCEMGTIFCNHKIVVGALVKHLGIP